MEINILRKSQSVFKFILASFVFLISSNITIASIPEINGSANIFLTDNYFWRVSGDGDPHLQYSFSLSTSLKNVGINLSPWISHDLSDVDIDEVDYTLDLSYSASDISANVGWVFYDVTGAEETSEIYTGAGYLVELKDKLTLSPGLKFYYDIDEIKKPYLEASISVDMDILKNLSASISTTIGYDLGQFIDNGLTVFQLGLSADYQVTEKITLTPGFTYILGIDDKFENDTFFGISVDFQF